MKYLLLLICLVLSKEAFSQTSIIKAPRDSTGTILYAGLGLPYLFNPSVSNTAYTGTDQVTLSIAGPDTGRQYRHLSIYNPSASIGIYVCVGPAGSACSRDMWYAPPAVGVIDDFAYFGAANNAPVLYWRVASTGSVSPVIRVW